MMHILRIQCLSKSKLHTKLQFNRIGGSLFLYTGRNIYLNTNLCFISVYIKYAPRNIYEANNTPFTTDVITNTYSASVKHWCIV